MMTMLTLHLLNSVKTKKRMREKKMKMKMATKDEATGGEDAEQEPWRKR